MTLIERHGAPDFPVVKGDVLVSSRETIDEAIQELQAHKDVWIRLSVQDRIKIIDDLIKNVHALAPRWVAASLHAKGIPEGSPAASEEWSAGLWPILKQLRQLRQTLTAIAAGKAPLPSGKVRTRSDGQVVVSVFPRELADALFFPGISAEMWMMPDVTVQTLPQTQACTYQETPASGKITLVLGAGNVASIPPLDMLYKLFIDNFVVILKMNPVNAYLGPLLVEAFQPLIEQGFLRVVYGGASEGAYLCNHPAVDEIHITGSDKTFDAIIFGTGDEGAQRKKEQRPLLAKPITAELGNVSPVIVVPGVWKASELAYHGEHIASMLTNNAGCNCNTTRVIILQREWPQREQLIQEIRRALSRTPPRHAFYPGASERQQSFIAAHPEAELLGETQSGELPWTFITNVDSSAENDICFTTEAFCSLFAATTLEADSVAEYIDAAVAFCNQKLWGTLNATMIVHPSSLKDPQVAEAVQRAIADLRYGTVSINNWAGVNYALGTTSWGAFPGHTNEDIQSGTGVVHNTLMFEQSQKAVVYAPFRAYPRPVWFVSQGKTALNVFTRLVDFEASPSPVNAAKVLWSALFG